MSEPVAPSAIENDAEYDVLIVGYGPVGRLLALRLGGRGHRVLVVERQLRSYFLPRAVHMDDEAARILQQVGASPADMPDAVGPYDDMYEWRNATGETLLELDWRGRGPSGWNVSNFFNQPLVESRLDAQVRDLETVTVANGWRATAHLSLGDLEQVTLESADGERSVRARYVVGADGSKSVVRDWIGGTTTDLGYFHDWLVVDLVMLDDSIAFTPPAWQLCDPERPTTLVPGGPGRRRFEFMRLPRESVAEMADEATAWRLVAPWGITPERARLERSTVYTFQAQWADAWRRGRLLIAGDAAHLMPPFAGQGMCSGLRDAANLEWKLDLVLSGRAADSLLNSYGPERAEHVRHFVESSMALGEIICLSDPDEAVARDARMIADRAAGTLPEPRPLPRLGMGVHRPGDVAAGLLSIQPLVRGPRGDALLDDVVGGGGKLLLKDASAGALLPDEAVDALARVGFGVVVLGEGADADVFDAYGEAAAWFGSLGAVAVLVRPDHYNVGSAKLAADVPLLVDDFLAMLRVEALA